MEWAPLDPDARADESAEQAQRRVLRNATAIARPPRNLKEAARRDSQLPPAMAATFQSARFRALVPVTVPPPPANTGKSAMELMPDAPFKELTMALGFKQAKLIECISKTVQQRTRNIETRYGQDKLAMRVIAQAPMVGAACQMLFGQTLPPSRPAASREDKREELAELIFTDNHAVRDFATDRQARQEQARRDMILRALHRTGIRRLALIQDFANSIQNELAREPGNARAQRRAAKLLVTLGRREEAVELVRSMPAPKAAADYLNWADVQFTARMFKEMGDTIQKGSELLKDTPDDRHLVLLNHLRVAPMVHSRACSPDDIQRKLHRKDVHSWGYFAVAQRMRGDMAGCANALRTYLGFKPTPPQVVAQILAWALPESQAIAQVARTIDEGDWSIMASPMLDILRDAAEWSAMLEPRKLDAVSLAGIRFEAVLPDGSPLKSRAGGAKPLV